MVARVKKNDSVFVLSGKDKGKKSTVLAISPKDGKVLVKDVAVVTRHVKARKQGDVAGIRKEERFIDVTCVMPMCTSCNKPCRVGSKTLENGKRVRVCVRCKEQF